MGSRGGEEGEDEQPPEANAVRPSPGADPRGRRECVEGYEQGAIGHGAEAERAREHGARGGDAHDDESDHEPGAVEEDDAPGIHAGAEYSAPGLTP